MTSPSEASGRAGSAFVWAWLPGADQPVVAGRLSRYGDGYRFGYGESYLARPDAISLYAPELPLRPGWIDPPEGLEMAGCLCVIAAHIYGLTRPQASDIIDRQVTAVRENWDDARDLARLTEAESRALLGRQILNPYAFMP